MEKFETNTVHDSSINDVRNSVGTTSTTNIFNPESQLLNGLLETSFNHENSFNGLRDSIGTSTTNIYNPESQLLNGMIKDNNIFTRKKSSVSNNSYLMDPNHSQELDLSDESFNHMDEISYGLSKDLLSESDGDSEYERNERNINELLLMKKNFIKAPESVASELDAQSSIYTDTETQSEYSVESTKLDPETIGNRIWYYKNSSSQNNEDDQNYSDDESTVDENTAAISKLQLHHYVSTNNLKVNKKDNPILKRSKTFATAKHIKSKLHSKKFDFPHDINDIQLFTNKEFKTEAKESYFVADPSSDDFRTSLLLSKTGDASRKRRSQMSSNRNRSYSHLTVNENNSTIAPPLSSKKLTSYKTNTNINNNKQPQLNSPMEVGRSNHLIQKSDNSSSNTDNTHGSTTTLPDANDENTNQIYKVFMMAKDLFSFGKVKRTNTIKSTSSRHSSIRKNQKKPSISRQRYSVKRKNTYSNLGEDDITVENNKYNPPSSSLALKKKSSNMNQSKNANRISNDYIHSISRNSSLLSASTRRSSFYKNKIYQNDIFLNYSQSNLSDSTGLDMDDAKKFEESYIDIHHNTKNNNLRVYGICPESYYSEYHAPIPSSVDGRSSYYEDEDEDSVVSESDNGMMDTYNDNYYGIKNKLTMQPITGSLLNSSNLIPEKNTSKFQKKSIYSSIEVNENNKKPSLRKPHSSSTIETNHTQESLTPTVTNGDDHDHLKHIDEKSETTTERNTTHGTTYGGDNKSTTTTTNTTVIPRNNINKYGAYSSATYNNNKHNWDEGSNSSMSRFNESESRYQEMASTPDRIKDYNNTSISPIPLIYYRLGVYMYITNPVIVQTRTIMEKMFSAHTIYTITVKLLKPNLPMYRNDKVCTFTVHKRYRQFRSFYKEIYKKYKYTITGWPEFPKKTFFDRFDTTTITERAKAFSSLMSFVSLHPHLYNCPVLLTFLEITGSMNNRLASINSNISKDSQLDNSNVVIEGKTIQFEGRNIAPSVPKLYSSIGNRQYPPGYFGYESNYDPLTVYPSNSLSPNNNMPRRPYYNADYYSSFSNPRVTKMKTTDILKNRNSIFSSHSSANEITDSSKNDFEANGSSKSVNTEPSTTTSQTTPKFNPVDLKNNELIETTPQANRNNNNTLNQNISTSPNSPDANYSDTTTPKIAHAVTALPTITTPESPISLNNDFITTPTPTQSTNYVSPLEAKVSTKSTSSSISSLTNEKFNLKIDIPEPKINNTDSIDSTDSTITTAHVHSNKVNNNNSILNSPISFISTTTTATTNATTTATITSTSPNSSHSSILKGKSILKDETIEENKSTTPPPVIPRPRPRLRPGNSTAFRAEDEMGHNYMSRYNHYQIPGFQYLISEFPKPRSEQTKRYSSIF